MTGGEGGISHWAAAAVSLLKGTWQGERPEQNSSLSVAKC